MQWKKQVTKVTFLEMGGDFRGIWALPLFVPFMVLSSHHHGNSQLSWCCGGGGGWLSACRWDCNDDVKCCLLWWSLCHPSLIQPVSVSPPGAGPVAFRQAVLKGEQD
jgi:hypothetical protein